MTEEPPANGATMRIERLAEASGRTFTPRVVRWMVGIAVMSLLMTLLLSVLASSDEPTRSTADANAFSYSAIGHRAFVGILERLDIDVTVSRHRSAEKAGPARPLLLLEPLDGDKQLEHLTEIMHKTHARDTPVLLALPKWTVFEADSGHRWANHIELQSPYRVDRALDAIDEGLSESELPYYVGSLSTARGDSETGTVSIRGRRTSWRLALEPYQLLDEDSALEPIVTVDDIVSGSSVLIGKLRGTQVYILSDPDILNTMGIGQGDHAQIAVAMVTEVLGAEDVVIDEVEHGFEKADTIWKELFGFPLILLTIHLAALLALTLWSALTRFGKPETRPPRVPSGKQTLLDNTATLLALGHHAGYGVKRYFETTLRRLAHSYGIAHELPEEARLAQLASIATRRGSKVDLRQLAREVGGLADRGGLREEHRARELARRIFAFKKELTHGHRSRS